VTAVAELPRPIGYVLGGGASLGAIQVGMLQALSEHDIVPDLVAGTSVGSLNGAALARGPNRWPRPPRPGGQRAPDTGPKSLSQGPSALDRASSSAASWWGAWARHHST
jgi:hypothetical protein